MLTIIVIVLFIQVNSKLGFGFQMCHSDIKKKLDLMMLSVILLLLVLLSTRDNYELIVDYQ